MPGRVKSYSQPGSILLLLLAVSGCHRTIGREAPDGFVYPPSFELVIVDRVVESKCLCGVAGGPTEAGIPDALVELRELVNGGLPKRKRALMTTEKGKFDFGFSEPGTYKIQISVAGFNDTVYTIRIDRAARKWQRFELSLGA